MKKIIIITTAILLSVSMKAQVDPHWNTDGNTGTDPNDDFVGTTDNADLRFRTFNTFQMTLTSPAGWLGLNTTNPLMRFHVLNGGILSTGTIGTNPDIGMGTRFMWIPDVGAIRAGFANGFEWDSPFVGENSAAFGSQNTASGDNSFAAGRNNNVVTLSAAAFGSNNSFNDAISAGRQGIDAFSAGRANYNEGDAGIALGLNNEVTHQAGIALGQLCEVTAVSAIAGGFQCESHGDHSFSVGYQAVSNGDHSVTIGHGINNTDHSLLVGFPQTGSILFAGPGIGGASVSGVGIGNVIEPTQRLTPIRVTGTGL